MFITDIDGDSLIGTPKPKDTNNDGLVDDVANYQIFNDGKPVHLQNSRGRTYSDATSNDWDAIAASDSDTGFKVLFEGNDSYEGRFFIYDTNRDGVITSGTSWTSTNKAVDLGWESMFNTDINGDNILA